MLDITELPTTTRTRLYKVQKGQLFKLNLDLSSSKGDVVLDLKRIFCPKMELFCNV